MDEKLFNSFRRAWAQSKRKRRELIDDPLTEKPRVRGMGHVLEALSEQEGKSQSALAFELGIRPQSLSEAIALLEERGEIQRQTDPTDRRVTLVFLTERGRIRREKNQKQRFVHAQHFFSALTQEEKGSLLLLLEKLNDFHNEKGGS